MTNDYELEAELFFTYNIDVQKIAEHIKSINYKKESERMYEEIEMDRLMFKYEIDAVSLWQLIIANNFSGDVIEDLEKHILGQIKSQRENASIIFDRDKRIAHLIMDGGEIVIELPSGEILT